MPNATYHRDARLITLKQQDVAPGHGVVLVVAAGTADLPIAEEAAITAIEMANLVRRLSGGSHRA